MVRKCKRCGKTWPVDEDHWYFYRSGQVNPWCKRCYRKWYEERSGGMVNRVCDWCGKILTVTGRKAAEVTFCSKACKDSAKNRAKQNAIDAAKPDRRCAWCGVAMPRTMRSDARFCSANCNMQAHRRTRNFRRRMGKGAPVKPRKEPLINFAEIAERDEWRCGICGGSVSKTREWPDVLAASLDHIVRISENGTNGSENLRLAHYQCNSSRH